MATKKGKNYYIFSDGKEYRINSNNSLLSLGKHTLE
jgi:hypothetical protein